jgi:(2Fe-2S) ferredoxin
VQADEPRKPEVSVAGETAKPLVGLNNSRRTPEFLQRQSNFVLPHQTGKYNNIISALAGGDDCPGNAIPAGTYTAAAPFTDSGDTTGANNTVRDVGGYYGSPAEGADHIYSFTLTGRGQNPQIQVTSTSTTYRPMIYILDSRTGGGCPAGTNNIASTNLIMLSLSSPQGTATLDRNLLRFLPLNVPLYLFVDSRDSGVNSSGPYTLRMQDVGIAPAPAPPTRTSFDFDGDGRSDISVFRPSNGVWYLNRSTQGLSAAPFGLSNDKLVPADYDGDGRTDVAVYRDGTWYLQRSQAGFIGVSFGTAEDIPVPADFTGDGRAELAVYRGGVWYTLDLQNNQSNAVQFGLSTDKPVAADYDGDGRADYAVYRDGIWYLLRSTQGFAAIQFGLPTDKLVPADYDGDGKTDVAVFRPSNGFWYLRHSLGGLRSVHFGFATDLPVPADYNGDYIADIAVFRPSNGTWYIRTNQFFITSFTSVAFGEATDKPVPNAFVP